MEFVNTSGKLPIKSWAPYDEVYNRDGGKSAIDQAIEAANLTFAFKHIALMADGHPGYGVPIGTVLATQDAVIPNAVGVDQGCGMQAMRTTLFMNDLLKDLQEFREQTMRAIPMGRGKQHRDPQVNMPPLDGSDEKSLPQILKSYELAKHQLGTLGSGNHFIEAQYDEEERIWIMIHSGSRKLGYDVAGYYNRMAKQMNRDWHTGTPKDLAFLPLKGKHREHGMAFLKELSYTKAYAAANRHHMMSVIVRILRKMTDVEDIGFSLLDVPHNYAQFEHHFNRNVVIHRKGATMARKGQLGIIPGSMGTSSFIVEGKGNPMSYHSCSHGAGRAMSRGQAKRNLNFDDQEKLMNGIVHGMKSEQKLDEAPGAYKDIMSVMANQEDLVDIVHTLTPFMSIKG